MVRRITKYPVAGELVIGDVSRVNPYSAIVRLEEYPGLEGMIHISEVARKWIKDIRDFVKEGQHVVTKVIRVEEGGHIELSLKRVSRNEADGKLKEVKQEQKAEKMLAMAGKEMGLNLDKAYVEMGFKLQEEFGGMWEGFKKSSTPEGRELLKKRGIADKWISALASAAEKTMETKEVEIKGLLELRTMAPNGIEMIKEALGEAEKAGIEVSYISAPKYDLRIRTKDAKKGEKMIRDAAEAAIKKLSAAGGEGKFERSD